MHDKDTTGSQMGAHPSFPHFDRERARVLVERILCRLNGDDESIGALVELLVGVTYECGHEDDHSGSFWGSRYAFFEHSAFEDAFGRFTGREAHGDAIERVN